MGCCAETIEGLSESEKFQFIKKKLRDEYDIYLNFIQSIKKDIDLNQNETIYKYFYMVPLNWFESWEKTIEMALNENRIKKSKFDFKYKNKDFEIISEELWNKLLNDNLFLIDKEKRKIKKGNICNGKIIFSNNKYIEIFFYENEDDLFFKNLIFDCTNNEEEIYKIYHILKTSPIHEILGNINYNELDNNFKFIGYNSLIINKPHKILPKIKRFREYQYQLNENNKYIPINTDFIKNTYINNFNNENSEHIKTSRTNIYNEIINNNISNQKKHTSSISENIINIQNNNIYKITSNSTSADTNILNSDRLQTIENIDNIKNEDINKNYISAFITCLCNINELNDYINNLNELDNNKILSNKFIQIIKNNNKNYDNIKFYNIKNFLETLHFELNESNKIENYSKENQLDEIIKKFKEENNSIISKLFYGLKEIKYICSKCSNSKLLYETHIYISLDMNYYSNKNITINDCISFYMNNNNSNCLICSNKNINKISKFIILPQILIIDFNNIENKKIKIEEIIELEEKKYELISFIIVNKIENNIEYNSYSKDNNNWYEYKENNKIKLENKIDEIINESNPSTIFYKLIK